MNEGQCLFGKVLLAAALLSKCQSPCSSKSFGLTQIIAAYQEQTGEIFQEMLKLKLCTPSKYVIWNGISIEKTTVVKKSHKSYLVKPFIVRDRYRTFLEFPWLSTGSLWYNSRQASFIPRSKDGSFKKQHTLTIAAGTQGSTELLLHFWEAIPHLHIFFFL